MLPCYYMARHVCTLYCVIRRGKVNSHLCHVDGRLNKNGNGKLLLRKLRLYIFTRTKCTGKEHTIERFIQVNLFYYLIVVAFT